MVKVRGGTAALGNARGTLLGYLRLCAFGCPVRVLSTCSVCPSVRPSVCPSVFVTGAREAPAERSPTADTEPVQVFPLFRRASLQLRCVLIRRFPEISDSQSGGGSPIPRSAAGSIPEKNSVGALFPPRISAPAQFIFACLFFSPVFSNGER